MLPCFGLTGAVLSLDKHVLLTFPLIQGIVMDVPCALNVRSGVPVFCLSQPKRDSAPTSGCWVRRHLGIYSPQHSGEERLRKGLKLLLLWCPGWLGGPRRFLVPLVVCFAGLLHQSAWGGQRSSLRLLSPAPSWYPRSTALGRGEAPEGLTQLHLQRLVGSLQVPIAVVASFAGLLRP